MENKDALSTAPKECTESPEIDPQIEIKTLHSISTEGLFEASFSC